MRTGKFNTIWVLTKRELRSTIYGIGIYIAVIISLIISSMILQNYIKSINRESILISASPLSYPLFISTAICVIYLAITSVISIARERDMQTLEVLFYGPINYVIYILSKFFKGLLSYLFIIIFLTVFFIFVTVVSNFGISIKFLKVLLLSFFLSSCMISFGIFISTLTKNVRSAVLLFLGIIGGLIAIQLMHDVFIKIEESNLSLLLINLRKTLSIVNGFIKWVSPLYYLHEGMEALRSDSTIRYILSMCFSIFYSIITIFLSVIFIKLKGVRKTTG